MLNNVSAVNVKPVIRKTDKNTSTPSFKGSVQLILPETRITGATSIKLDPDKFAPVQKLVDGLVLMFKDGFNGIPDDEVIQLIPDMSKIAKSDTIAFKINYLPGEEGKKLGMDKLTHSNDFEANSKEELLNYFDRFIRFFQIQKSHEKFNI